VGIGAAMDVTGSAKVIAGVPIWLAGGNPWVTLAVVYLVTMVATEFITNVAAAALMFPLAMSVAAGLDVNEMPFVITVMMAASASFSTPIGYQTNLMVYGPGGYHFTDYLRVGLPLGLLVWAITIGLAPLVWPF